MKCSNDHFVTVCILYSIAIISLPFSVAAGTTGNFHIIPYDVDPPIQIDADLSDWANIPNPIYVQSKEHVTYQQIPWKGPQDLSAIVRLAWREGGIYIAAEVTDDIIIQPFSGSVIYKGDYIDLWLDLKPTFEVERSLPANGQVHIGLSPGNCRPTITDTGSTRPETVIFLPDGIKAQDTKIAARRTETGYVLEAFIPSAILGLSDIQKDAYARFEVLISDSDKLPSVQQKIMSIGTDKWNTIRSRFLPAVFGDGNGEAILPASSTVIVKEALLKDGATASYKFHIKSIAPNTDTFLILNARAVWKDCGGYCTEALSIEINGNRLEEDYLTNRGTTGLMRMGKLLKLITPDGRVTLPWAHDFTSTDEHQSYAMAGQKSSEFEFIVSDFLKNGENTLLLCPRTSMIISGTQAILPEISVKNVELRTLPKTARSGLLAPAPKGELAIYEPITVSSKTYKDLRKDKNTLEFRTNGEVYRVESLFSTPDGTWNAGSNSYFDFVREVKECNEWIIVRDTFVNRTKENLPLMQSHNCSLGARTIAAWLQGVKVDIRSGHKAEGSNPSSLAVTDNGGIGLLALNDEFRVHIEQTIQNGNIGISDQSFVLKPGAQYTAEWAIVPVTTPDFWHFVNTARRLLEVNFELKYTFAFVMGKEPVYSWSDETFKRFVENKSADFLVQDLTGVLTKDGFYARGPDWVAGPHKIYSDFQTRVHRLYPDGSKKTGMYFDCFLDTHEPDNERFASDRGLDAQGNHLRYGEGKDYSYMKLFIPTMDNGWGREIAKVIDVSLDKIGINGIFWDEFTYSITNYSYNDNVWDGCSGDINPTTHKLERLKNSLTLLSRDFREYQVKRVLERGAPLVINGAPRTRTLSRYKFMAFGETGDISHLMTMILYSPVALGDHITERSGKDTYRDMLRALDNGCLYAWYSTFIIPEHKSLTEHMFPFTPIELHSGYVIGKERIITNHSGLFGWANTSSFSAYVYDRQGKETKQYPVKEIQRNNKTYAEVRIPGGFSCAIVRSDRK